MHVLFLHRAFPSQFGHLAAELSGRYGWRCSFLAEEMGTCPPPSGEMLGKVDLHRLPPAAGPVGGVTHWMRAQEVAFDLCRRQAAYLRGRPDLRPDLVVGHCGLGPVLFLDGVVDCPLVSYCEYYHAPAFGDLTYRVDLPPVELASTYPRCINATTLLGLVASDSGYSATEAQRRSFPERFRPRLEVHFDGIDTALYRPRPREAMQLLGRSIPRDAEVITFVSRGLESIRGFDLFLELARVLMRERPDLIAVVAGSEWSYYAWDRLHTGSPSFKDWATSRAPVDPSRFVFLGQLEPEVIARILARSDLHVYPTVPFVPSWSLFDAMSCGAVVLGSDVGAVADLVEPGRTGLLAPLFDLDAQLDLARRVLDDPAAFAPIGRAARDRIEAGYSMDVCIPRLRDYFGRIAGEAEGLGRRPDPASRSPGGPGPDQ
ncbi:glycosyltransferase [Tautonia plasticadhaerens]|uniref:Spore coat protein SA n=1 Tax=Tautonia plasticadhaerens TaxID=2527974 RepID=A0A518HAQ7_9BACT|nr:glycosyltransferase [Tautonia plasticadhaerens]QDV37934.1 Spore coat protein SA [Tautonia plasticadhaerens]